MSVDVDAVNERLNGLVTLLKAVGVDSLDNAGGEMKATGGLGGLPNAQQLDDDQIEAIIKKLQKAQAEAPQIIAALEAHAEARSLTGSQNRAIRSSSSRQPEPEPEEDEDDEDDDEFDEDANYPMVGHGESDDISVVSDLTTPTVLTGVPVPEEEHYRDTLPPMIVGGGADHAPAMIIAAPKKKNLVGQVRPGGPPRRGPPRGPGGAAAARRNKYQNTMAKLGENDDHPAPRRPMKPKQRPSGNGGQVRKKKAAQQHHSELGASRQQNDFAGESWNAFENKPRVPNKAPTMIDNDGFLTSEGFDPFAADNNPFKSSAGDLEFGGRFSSNASASGFESFEGGKSNPRRVKKKAPTMQSNFSASGERKVRPSGQSGGASSGARRPRARRASLAM